MRFVAALVVCGCVAAQGVWAESSASGSASASAKMAERVMKQWPAGVVTTQSKPGEWAYEEGVLLDGMAAESHTTANGDDFRYIKAAVDKYVGEDGAIKGYNAPSHNLDNIEMGRAVLLVYRVTQQAKYYKAAKFLHEQLEAQPRTASGRGSHPEIYTNPS